MRLSVQDSPGHVSRGDYFESAFPFGTHLPTSLPPLDMASFPPSIPRPRPPSPVYPRLFPSRLAVFGLKINQLAPGLVRRTRE